MKIESARTYTASSAKKINKKLSVNGGFFVKSDQDSDLSDKINDINSIGSLSSLDALLAVQEVNNQNSSNKNAVFKGKKILNLLDELKFGLLNGKIPQSKLDMLLNAVKLQNNKDTEPRLAAILDEIELRASVELAKLGK